MGKTYTAQYNAKDENGNWFYFADNEEVSEEIAKDLLAGEWLFLGIDDDSIRQAHADEDGALYAEIVIFDDDGEEIGRKSGYIIIKDTFHLTQQLFEIIENAYYRLCPVYRKHGPAYYETSQALREWAYQTAEEIGPDYTMEDAKAEAEDWAKQDAERYAEAED